MKNFILSAFAAIALTFAMPTFATGTGGQPNIPCFKDGEMIHASIEIYKCEAMGGTIDPEEAGIDTPTLQDALHGLYWYLVGAGVILIAL